MRKGKVSRSLSQHSHALCNLTLQCTQSRTIIVQYRTPGTTLLSFFYLVPLSRLAQVEPDPVLLALWCRTARDGRALRSLTMGRRAPCWSMYYLTMYIWILPSFKMQLYCHSPNSLSVFLLAGVSLDDGMLDRCPVSPLAWNCLSE